jgi:hypothetical protein
MSRVRGKLRKFLDRNHFIATAASNLVTALKSCTLLIHSSLTLHAVPRPPPALPSSSPFLIFRQQLFVFSDSRRATTADGAQPWMVERAEQQERSARRGVAALRASPSSSSYLFLPRFSAQSVPPPQQLLVTASRNVSLNQSLFEHRDGISRSLRRLNSAFLELSLLSLSAFFRLLLQSVDECAIELGTGRDPELSHRRDA